MAYKTRDRASRDADRERSSVGEPPRERRSGPPWAWLLGALLLVAVIWIAFETFTADEPEGPDLGATASEIVDDPDAYMGDTVVVSGEVNDVGGNHFTIGDDELLVVSANTPRGASEGDLLQVIGTVRLFALVDVEDELGVDLDDAVLAEFQNRPAIVADAINLEPRVEARPQDVTFADLLAQAGELEGRTVTVEAAVTEILSPTAFALGERVLVVAAADAIPQIEVGDTARVTGRVGEFDARLVEEELGVVLEDDLAFDWRNELMLVASSVSTS